MATAEPTPLFEDEVLEGGEPEQVLANARVRVGHYFAVPKVLDE